ncbi:Coiled-coil domain-containing protein 194 [Camelus dromedarius]|uniref:Coiled-coil domain-containing protein 194 n=1 Tax=Camelus dromedarius TaxID=9838 RepID=A0A5N4CM74_CAMDR|nr:Coiled-coil domain-containing protein 194 [Camelus dromedarius]
MLDCCRKLMQRGRKLPGWLWFLLFLMVLVVVALLVPLIIFTIRANSKSCKDGLQAEQECQNSTNLLQRQLTQTEEVLQETKAQATICIQSVETLRDSLEKEKALGREQLARAEELQAVAAGAALLAWNLAASASRKPLCPEPGTNTTAPPGDPAPEVEELRRRLAEAAQREEALTRQLNQAESVRGQLEEALRACEGRQSRLQTQLMTLKTEMDEAKAQGTQMGAENGALTEALARWEAAATESAQRLDEAQRRARAAVAEGEACAAREAALRERV